MFTTAPYRVNGVRLNRDTLCFEVLCIVGEKCADGPCYTVDTFIELSGRDGRPSIGGQYIARPRKQDKEFATDLQSKDEHRFSKKVDTQRYRRSRPYDTQRRTTCTCSTSSRYRQIPRMNRGPQNSKDSFHTSTMRTRVETPASLDDSAEQQAVRVEECSGKTRRLNPHSGVEDVRGQGDEELPFSGRAVLPALACAVTRSLNHRVPAKQAPATFTPAKSCYGCRTSRGLS